MGTTTVRLDEHDDALLDALAPEYGGRSSVIRHALQLLAVDTARKRALQAFVDEWDDAEGGIDDDQIDATAARFGLGTPTRN